MNSQMGRSPAKAAPTAIPQKPASVIAVQSAESAGGLRCDNFLRRAEERLLTGIDNSLLTEFV